MEINQVTFSYDKKTDQLKAVSGTVDAGKITTIIGPNGCGKSTLLGIMSRHHTPSSGYVLLDGKAVSSYKPKELAQKLSVVHQHNDAPQDLTIEKLARMGRHPHNGLFRHNQEEDDRAVEWALSCTGLLDKRGLPIERLSGGERQRVWIAMALAQRTPILFLDEPTTYLDMYHQIELLELVRTLNQAYGLTIVMVLHDINQAIRYSDLIMVMHDGRIVAKGPPAEVITRQALQDIYGVQAVVKSDRDVGMYVVPIGI